LKASHVDLKVRTLIQASERSLDRDKSFVALTTGVHLANVLLSVEEGDKAFLLGLMKQARAGLGALEAAPELLSNIDGLMRDYESGAVVQAELSPALDLLAGRIQEELAKGGRTSAATLVQAGGWVQSVNLLSRTLAEKGVTGDATALLKQPTVLAYFREFLASSPLGMAGNADVASVIAEMDKLKVVAEKSEITLDDLKLVAASTTAILAHF
jgi:hypothetical protein